MFLILEALFKQLQMNLEKLKHYNGVSEALLNNPDANLVEDVIKFRNQVTSSIHLWQAIQDKQVKMLEDIRTNHKIDAQLAAERDDMDQNDDDEWVPASIHPDYTKKTSYYNAVERQVKPKERFT